MGKKNEQRNYRMVFQISALEVIGKKMVNCEEMHHSKMAADSWQILI